MFYFHLIAMLLISFLFLLFQTGWGTRAGIGGATEALNAMNAQDAKQAAGGASGLGTPAEKFGSVASYPTDDGRRYDPEALSYGNGGAQPGYAR